MFGPTPVWRWLACLLVVVLGAGCATHSMTTLPGAMSFRFIVNNGTGEVLGRVRYTHFDDRGARTFPVAGARIDVRDGTGAPAAGLGTATTNGQGIFRLGGFSIGQAYFLR